MHRVGLRYNNKQINISIYLIPFLLEIKMFRVVIHQRIRQSLICVTRYVSDFK